MSDIKMHLKKESDQALYREVMADMRALRDVEMKFVPFFFQISAFVVTANIVLMVQAAPRPVVIAVGTLSIAFTLIFAGTLIWKIGRDHENHAWLGKRAQAIWQSWQVFEFFDEANYGSGKGYQTNQLLIATCAAFVLLTVCFGLTVNFP
jgi:hypothetical protein